MFWWGPIVILLSPPVVSLLMAFVTRRHSLAVGGRRAGLWMLGLASLVDQLFIAISVSIRASSPTEEIALRAIIMLLGTLVLIWAFGASMSMLRLENQTGPRRSKSLTRKE